MSLLFIDLALAKQPDYAKLPISKPFLFNFGIGYGLANQPLIGESKSATSGGIVIAGSLGYRFSKKICLEFGPSFWFEGKDVFNNSAANNNRPSNKRMLISFNGYYKPHAKVPVQIKLGAGIGNMVYSPAQKVITADRSGVSNTEFVNGFAGCIGLLGEVKIADSFKIHPSLNFSYTDIRKQKIEYTSRINHLRPSVIADMRLNFMFTF